MFREARSYVRRHHVGMLALFVALGGTSCAATALPRNSVGSPQLRAGAVRASDVADGAITLRKLDGATRRRLSGQAAAAGPQGPAGPEGPAGPKGDTGAPDTSNLFTKAESDARFLGLGATATDSTLLGGMPAIAFVQGTGSIRSFARPATGLDAAIFDIGGIRIIGTCGTVVSSLAFGNLSGATVHIFDETRGIAQNVGTGGTFELASVNNNNSAGTVLHVAWGTHVTTFIASLTRPAACPADVWATAITSG